MKCWEIINRRKGRNDEKGKQKWQERRRGGEKVQKTNKFMMKSQCNTQQFICWIASLIESESICSQTIILDSGSSFPFQWVRQLCRACSVVAFLIPFLPREKGIFILCMNEWIPTHPHMKIYINLYGFFGEICNSMQTSLLFQSFWTFLNPSCT
jgi:hypothetical protein